MQRQISVVLDRGQEFSFHVPEGVALAHDAALGKPMIRVDVPSMAITY